MSIWISESDCTICLEKLSGGKTVSWGSDCSHSYHKDCIIRWICEEMMKGEFPRCPNCRGWLVIPKEIIDEFIENSDDDEVSQVLKLLQDHNNKISKCSTCSSTNSEAELVLTRIISNHLFNDTEFKRCFNSYIGKDMICCASTSALVEGAKQKTLENALKDKTSSVTVEKMLDKSSGVAVEKITSHSSVQKAAVSTVTRKSVQSSVQKAAIQSGASSGIFNFAFNGVIDTYKYSSGQITGEELKEKTKYNVVESASQAVLVGGIAALAGPVIPKKATAAKAIRLNFLMKTSLVS